MDVVAAVVVVALAVAVVVVSFPSRVAEACAHSFVLRDRSRPLFLGWHAVVEESGNRRAKAEDSLGTMGRSPMGKPRQRMVGVLALVVDGSARRTDTHVCVLLHACIV